MDQWNLSRISIAYDWSDIYQGRSPSSTSRSVALDIAFANGPWGVSFSASRLSISDDFPRGDRLRSGPGDIVTTGSYRFAPDAALPMSVGLSGSVKIPVASREVGTGKYDFGYQLDVLYTVDQLSAFVAAGQTLPGKLDGERMRNPLYVYAGAQYRFQLQNRTWDAGMYALFRERTYARTDDARSLVPYFEVAIDGNLSLLGYTNVGIGPAAGHMGYGARLTYRFR